jgi:hypothetical protein
MYSRYKYLSNVLWKKDAELSLWLDMEARKVVRHQDSYIF